ncbi:MAG: ABC transporter permease [Rhodospirillaceae bacterium]|nr:ABC transporter permease [Rhodospirillaceae bacterium]
MTGRHFFVRSLTTLITIFGVAVVVFFVIRIAPGDPVSMMLPPGATDEDIQILKTVYGLDKSMPEQFVIWLKGIVGGDFGTSISLRQDVMGLVLGRLPATLELSFVALFVAVFLGGGLAVLGTLRAGSVNETAIDLWNGISLSVPDFLWGLALIMLLGVWFPVLPVSGRISPSLDLDFSTQFLLLEAVLRFRFDVISDLLKHMMLPALALALPLAAIISQVLKQSLKEVMRMDYIMLARSKGFSESRVLLLDGLRNAILPTLTLIGVQFSFLIGGTVIIEKLYSYEGLGNLAIDAVINRDLPLIQGIVLTFAVIFIIINIVIDVLYTMLNPRLRHG